MSWTGRPLSVDSRLLLGFCAIIPLSFAVIAADAAFFGHTIRSFLPAQPESFLWFLFIFNLPHIMASLVTYADADYLRAYKRPLIKGSFVSILVPIAISILIGVNEFFIFIAFYTVYHVLMQQYGISLMFLKRPPNLLYQFWRWLSIGAGCLLYLNVYRPNALMGLTGVSLQTMGVILTLLSLPFGLLFYAQIKDATRTSRAYFLATYAILPASCAVCVLGYPFLLVLIPRFIHDATAFAVYAVHDHNRNLTVKHNVIYRALAPLHLSPVILCLPLAIGLAWYFTAHQYDSVPVMGCLVFFMMLHYYMEGYMWKRGMPHRQSVGFTIA